MADAKIRLSVEGATMVKSELDKVNAGLSGMAREAAFLKSTLLGLAGGLSAGAFYGFVKGAIDAADAMNDMSQRTGILVKNLAVYELAANQSGTSMDAIARGVKGLSGVMSTNSEAMKAAGITATDTNGAMIQLADMFAKMPDSLEKTNLAVKIFGKSGMDLIPMLNMGRVGLQEAADKAAKYAAQMVIMAPLSDAFNDNMAEIAINSKVMGMTMLNTALPALNEITKAMADASQKGGTFAGVMAGVSAATDVYWKNVGKQREMLGFSPANTGGASGSWADDGRKGLSDPRIVKPEQKKEIDASTAALIKALTERGSGAGGGKATTEKISEYTRMAEAISKVNTQAVQELANGGKLAASDKFQVEEMQKITFAFATHKISQQERIKLTEQTAAAAAKMLEVERQAAGIKANQANYAEQVEFAKELGDAEVALSRAREQGRAVLADYAQAIDLDNRLTAFEITLIGKTESAKLKALELYRIEIELKKQLAAIDGNAGFDQSQRADAYAAANAAAEQAKAGVDLKAQKIKLSLELKGYDATAAQLESLANITGKMGDGWKKATAGLSGFSNAFKNLATLDKNTALSANERTQAQVGGYAEMAGAAKQFFDEGTAGYEVLGAAEQAFRAIELAMSIAAMVQKATETTASIAQNVAGTGPALIKGAAEMFAQSGWGGFVGVAAMIALIAGMGGSSGGGGSGGGAGGTGSNGKFEGSGMSLGRSGNATSNLAMQTGESPAAEAQMRDAEDAQRAADALNNLNAELRKTQYGASALEQDLADVKTATQGAGRAQYELATNGMDGSQVAAYNYNAVLEAQIQVLLDVANGTQNASENMKKLVSDTVSLTIDVKRAQGDIAGANYDQMLIDTRGYTEAEIAVYNHNQTLKDQIASYSASSSAADDARQAEEELGRTRYEVSGRLNVLLGRQTQIQFERATELAGATDATVIGMLNEIYVLEDLTAARDASFATLERSIAAERKFAEVRLKGATDLQSALKTAFNAVNPALSVATARTQLSMFSELARSGGTLPSAEAIRPALDVLSKVTTDTYKTAFDYYRDQARTANDISDLAGYADKQVSVEQQTVDRLDLQLETAKQALDVLKGIDNSIVSVAAADAAFYAAMMSLTAAQAGAASYSFAAPAGSSGGGGGGGGGGGYGGGAAGDPAYAAAIAGMDSDIVAAYKGYYGRAPDRAGHDSFIQSGLVGDPLMQAILRASAASRGADYDYAMSKGYNPDDPMANYLRSKKTASGGSTASESYNAFADGGDHMGGLRLVGERGPELEATGPSRITNTESLMSMLRSGNGSNEALVAEIKGLRAEVVGLRAEARANANHSSKTAGLLDDVINGGRTINTVSEVVV